MGEIWVKGERAFDLLQRVTSNDVSAIAIRQAQYSCFVNEQGGIIDDLIIYRYEHDKYMLVVNASNVQKDWDWLVGQNKVRAELENSSDNIGQLAVQGPKALATLQKLTKIELSVIPYYHFTTGYIAGTENVIIANTGYTGAGGFELYFYKEHGVKLWNEIMQAGEEFGIKPIGLGARDTLRLEMGYSLYGNDIDDTTSPLEAGLGWITKFTDGNDFIGRDVLEKQKAAGLTRKLCGFELLERGIPRHSYDIVNEAGETIGAVTSGTMSPTRKIGVGLGYVRPEYADVGSKIYIKIREKAVTAKVVRPPFRR
jgi:aminomethyltransferase